MWGFFLLCTVSAQIMCDYCFACNTYGAKQHRGHAGTSGTSGTSFKIKKINYIIWFMLRIFV